MDRSGSGPAGGGGSHVAAREKLAHAAAFATVQGDFENVQWTEPRRHRHLSRAWRCQGALSRC